MSSSLEHAYFAAKDAERRRALREKLEDIAKTAVVAEQLGTDDEALARRIRGLGFEGETARVFDLLPLIHMSWADGTVQHEERVLIFAVLEKRQVEPSSEAWVLVETLLEKRPSEHYISESLEVVKILRDKRGGRGNIVELCQLVAEAAGGFLGVHTISKGERELLAEIADKLGAPAEAKLQEQLT